MATVRIDGVRKAYGGLEVIHGVSMEIEEGEFTVLVGPSGCGKSTLLRMIAGLEHISAGDVWIDDKIINDTPPSERDIAMVFQSYALYPHMTVADNMGFSMRLRGSDKAEIRRRVEEAAVTLSLSNYLERYPRQLSGGQRQRVAMGRAIVRNPKVFLFDEPLSNLDAKLRVQMRYELRQMHRRLRTTTIYVTHDQIEAMTMADRIVVMHDGIVEQIGAPLELYDRPANLFVAQFIGSPSMNILPGTIRTEGGPRFELDDGTILPLRSAPAGTDGLRAHYGIRPENLALSGESPVLVDIDVVEPTGSETMVFSQLGGQAFTGVFRERLTQAGQINLYPDLGRVHLFRADTGARLE